MKLVDAMFGADQSEAEVYSVKFTSKVRALPRQFGEALVGMIDRQKYNLLALSFVGTIIFGLFVCFGLFVSGERDQFTKSVEGVGGYVAIAGLVIGLPALAYAMVTDSAVHRIESMIGANKKDVKGMRDKIGQLLAVFHKYLGSEHFIQVFVPEIHRARLVPLYDPDEKGPRDGWSIDRTTPQAITGSAWVNEEFLCGVGSDELSHSKLRLTEEQLRQYEDLTAVAAIPIFDGSGDNAEEIVGVLTVFSTAKHPRIEKNGHFREKLEAEAEALGPDLRNYVAELGPLSPEDLATHR